MESKEQSTNEPENRSGGSGECEAIFELLERQLRDHEYICAVHNLALGSCLREDDPKKWTGFDRPLYDGEPDGFVKCDRCPVNCNHNMANLLTERFHDKSFARLLISERDSDTVYHFNNAAEGRKEQVIESCRTTCTLKELKDWWNANYDPNYQALIIRRQVLVKTTVRTFEGFEPWFETRFDGKNGARSYHLDGYVFILVSKHYRPAIKEWIGKRWRDNEDRFIYRVVCDRPTPIMTKAIKP